MRSRTGGKIPPDISRLMQPPSRSRRDDSPLAGRKFPERVSFTGPNTTAHLVRIIHSPAEFDARDPLEFEGSKWTRHHRSARDFAAYRLQRAPNLGSALLMQSDEQTRHERGYVFRLTPRAPFAARSRAFSPTGFLRGAIAEFLKGEQVG
jgi:hypothetical protein